MPKVKADVRISEKIKEKIREEGKLNGVEFPDMYRLVLLMGMQAIEWLKSDGINVKEFYKSLLELEEKENV